MRWTMQIITIVINVYTIYIYIHFIWYIWPNLFYCLNASQILNANRNMQKYRVRKLFCSYARVKFRLSAFYESSTRQLACWQQWSWKPSRAALCSCKLTVNCIQLQSYKHARFLHAADFTHTHYTCRRLKWRLHKPALKQSACNHNKAIGQLVFIGFFYWILVICRMNMHDSINVIICKYIFWMQIHWHRDWRECDVCRYSDIRHQKLNKKTFASHL